MKQRRQGFFFQRAMDSGFRRSAVIRLGWIAAAQQVIELDLCDLCMTRNRNLLRAGSASRAFARILLRGFPMRCQRRRLWRRRYRRVNMREVRTLAKIGNAGWEWAGVEGQWRYVTSTTTPPVVANCSDVDLACSQ